MKPVSGEKLPLQSISRSQSWRGVRSQEGQSRDWALISLARLALTVRSINLPPWGVLRWLVTCVLSMFAEGEWLGDAAFEFSASWQPEVVPVVWREGARLALPTPGGAGGCRDRRR